MPTTASMKPLLKGLLYILGGLLILLVIAQLLVTFFADDYAADRLRDRVRQSTDSTYTLDFDDLSLNVFSGSATIKNLHIRADTSAFARDTSSSAKPPQTLYRGTIGEVDVSGLNVFSTLMGNELRIGSVVISGPDITVLKNPRTILQDSSGQFGSIDSSIYAAIRKDYSALQVGEFSIEDGKGRYTQSGDTLASLEELNIGLRDIRVDSASAQSGRRFITDDISVNLQRLMYNLADSVNKIKLGAFSISSDDKTISADSLQLIPRYPRFAYSRQNGSRKDRIDLLIPEITISAVDFSSYIDSARFYAQFAEINNAHFEDFLNKTAWVGPKKQKTLPLISFKRLNQPIKIDSLKINDAFISYSEYVGNTSQAGTITFEELNATLRNISNYEADVQEGVTTTLDARSRVMGTGLLDVHFDFPMDTKIGFHKIEGRLNSMPMTDFNRITEDVAFVRIDRGMINSLEFDMRLDENSSNGTLIMNYENLKISVLDKQSLQQKGIMENLKTFAANIVVNANNTPEAGMQAGTIRFDRIQHKSTFNYWWKSLLSGIKESVK